MSWSLPCAGNASDRAGVDLPEDARFVFSTDLSGDIDDAAAFGFLFEAVQRERGILEAVVTDSPTESAAPAARAMLDAFGFEAVPVGAYQGSAGDTRDGPYARHTADTFGQSGKTRADFPEDVTVLRSVYESAPDRSIVFIAVGFLNSLEGLMRSPAENKPGSLDGPTLFERKTAYVVAVGANFLGNPDGKTRWNWKHAPESAEFVLNRMKRPFFWLPANEIDQAGFPENHARSGDPALLNGTETLGWNAESNPIQFAFEKTRENHPGLLADGLRRKAFDPAAVRFATDLDTRLFGFHHQGIHLEMRKGAIHAAPDRAGPFTILEIKMPTASNEARDYLDGILGRLRGPTP